MDSIIITGCSYNGMLSALALAKQGLKSLIIERRNIDEGFFYDPRTTSITASSKTFFDQLNIWQSLEQFVAPIEKIYVVDNKNPVMLEFDNDGFNYLGYMIENYNLKKMLYRMVSQNPLITLVNQSYASVSFNSIGCVLEVGEQIIQTPLLVVCDGKNSTLRAKYFPYMINKDYAQIAFVFNVRHEKNHENCAVEHFLPTGPFAILPLIDKNHSAIVWSVKVDLAIVYRNLDQQSFQDLVQDLFGDFLGKIGIITKISSFNLSAQIVEKYYYNNIVLVGDSAHCIHPLAGQGLNQGIKDIKALSQVIKKYYDLGLTINSCALDEYQKNRKFDNMQMFMATDAINKVFSNTSAIMDIIRNTGFRLLNKFSFIKKRIIDYGIGN